MKNIYQVFVYGTLRQHESNHHLLKEARCVSRQCWTNGTLYDTGCGYPAMIASTSNRVYGEVYAVTDEQLKRLDELEGYAGEGKDNLYERITQVIYTDFETTEAFVYVFSNDNVCELDELEFGDWKCHRYLQQDELLYFAYGSCMDEQRFQLAGVKYEFERVLGCGIAKYYSLAYTRKAHDGGRADLIESEEEVEGKVYHISREALPYLYRREGVTAHIYRPAFVDIVMDEKTYRNVLTFLVVDKTEAVAPPEHYATEILRGAKGFVSDSYYQKLETDLHIKFKINNN
ncbi:gamma-glutamylcyclotransferase [Alkalihalobacterium elongatum]|uniref:gamma-glutamylcyclotransferase n=1 Tax=Alkalihalobacterium elongatum TaxID=2675466 RepID=UPI001C1FE898|nr:gamma-glutamylcyclotransferase family protein [Alkalihalobacterium elongatum]